MNGQNIPEEPRIIQPSELVYQEEIGHGGYGIVYSGRYHGQQVAIKELKDEYQNQLLTIEQHIFENDIRNLFNYSHPNIVRFIGAVTEHGRRALVMELMKGPSLYRYIHIEHHDEAIGLAQIYKIVMDIASAISRLQNEMPNGEFVSHGDLHTNNVLLNQNRTEAKVMDFGLSQLLQRTTSDKLLQRCPTHAYVSPEQFQGIRSHKSDVFSIGMIAWELYTRKVPFRNYELSTPRGPMIPAYLVLEKNRPDIPEDMPQGLRELIVECWQHDKNLRPYAWQVRERCRKVMEELQAQH